MVSKPPLHQHLDTLFEKLDAAIISENIILKSEKSKEHYETRLMFAFRKLQAARHHLDNVHRLKDVASKELNDAAPPDVGQIASRSELGGVKARVVVRRMANEYAFELSACLTATKGSLDFLATVCALHLSGVKADSIRTLMRLVEKGKKTDPLLYEVAEKLIWLKELRNYRDHLVHRLCIVPTSGWAMESVEGQVVKQSFPVVVPQGTPKFVADTRRARLMDEELTSGLAESRSEAWITYPGAAKELLEHSLSYEAAPGLVPIEELMQHHIAELEEFFEKIVLRLIDLDFKSVSLS